MAFPLDSFATIFIFLIGLPAILLQTLPAEIRRAVLQERRQVALFTLGPIVLAGSVVGLGAYLTHPAGAGLPPGDEAELRADMVWFLITAGMVLIAGTAALVLTEYWRRASVIKRLRRAAARGIRARGRPVETELRTLVELGIQSQAGEDKGMVIKALARLVVETQSRAGYDGAQLEDVITGIEDVFVSGAHFGSPDNFLAAADLLLGLVLESRDRPDSDDLKAAVQAVSLLGRASLRHEQSHIQIKFIEALAFAGDGDDIGYATWASQALFEIGSQAIESDLSLVTMTALSKMEMLVLQHRPVQGELAWDFIGLLAHCWARRETGRDYSRQFLDQAADLFEDPLPEVIRKAREACMQTARFRTSDHLARMLAELGA
jgi:hypothetical protein